MGGMIAASLASGPNEQDPSISRIAEVSSALAAPSRTDAQRPQSFPAEEPQADGGGTSAEEPRANGGGTSAEEPRANGGGTSAAETRAGEPPRIREYVVEPGDTLGTVARKFGLSAEMLVWSNDLDQPDVLRVGEQLWIPPVAGLIHRVAPGDTVVKVAERYEARVPDIIAANGLQAPFVINVGQPLIVPGGVMPAPPSTPPQPLPAPLLTDSVEAPPRSDERVAAVEAPPGEGATLAESGDAAQAEEPQVAAAAVDIQPLSARPSASTLGREGFIEAIAPAAQASQRETGVPASVTIAQAILETYWGSSQLAREANNFFGIKAHRQPGSAGVFWINAWEVINGRNVTRREPFRAYNDYLESFVDHGLFFHQNQRYARALQVRGDPRQFAREINRAGYATDPAYARKLISLMDTYNLYRFDP